MMTGLFPSLSAYIYYNYDFIWNKKICTYNINCMACNARFQPLYKIICLVYENHQVFLAFHCSAQTARLDNSLLVLIIAALLIFTDHYFLLFFSLGHVQI